MKKEALALLGKVVGEEHVRTEPGELERYRWGDIPLDVGLTAAVLPAKVEEVQEVVRIAGEHGVGLYPISTGKNWGYGAARPVVDGSVILDLGRMNRIITVDEKLAYAVVEPGVTQLQLYRYLEERNIPLIIDPTGAGPGCSILGNTLERGYGITPYGDHFLQQCGMEVVLADGEILKTGFGHYDNAKATHVFKYGVGPYLDGLFTQSSFGIVTRMGVWLMPRASHFAACYFSVAEDESLGDLVDAVRNALLHDAVRGSVNLLHRNRMLTLLSQYPWEEMEGKVPISEEVARKIAARKNIGAWNGVTALYGTREQVRAGKKALKKHLGGIATELHFVTEKTLNLLERFRRPAGFLMRMNITELIGVLRPSLGILQGTPNEVALATPYWRMKKGPPAEERNPAQDNCGVIWLSPVVPMTREHVAEFRGIVEPIFTRHDFDCCLTLTAVTNRCFDCTAPILYDREDPGEKEKADACYRELVEACMHTGYIPYRVGIQSMAEFAGKRDTFWDTVEKIKKTLDPRGTISPGRYSKE